MRNTILFAAACLALIASAASAQTQPLTREFQPVSDSAGSHANRAGTRNGTTGTAAASVPEDFANLLLEPGFLLDLAVYDMPEISSQLRVDHAGDVTVPLSGTVHVAGLTLPEARERIEAKLVSSGILLHPKTNLDVLQYAGSNITVLGEVQTPGRLPLLAPHSLDDVLAMAGGESQLAGSTIEISHPQDGASLKRVVHYDRKRSAGAGRDVEIQPGDTVVVPRAGIVYVLGAVNRPGGYLLQEDGTLDVAGAISVASGTSLDASIGSMRIIRKAGDGTLTSLPVAYRKITEGREQPAALHDGDILYVPISKLKSVLSAGIASSASSALIYSVR